MLSGERNRDRRGRFALDTSITRIRRQSKCRIDGKEFLVAQVIKFANEANTITDLANRLKVRPKHCISQLSKLRASGIWIRLFRVGSPEGRKIKGYEEYQAICDAALNITCKWLGVTRLPFKANNVLSRLALRVAVYLVRTVASVPLNALNQTMGVHNLRASAYCEWVERLRDDPVFDQLLNRLTNELLDK